MRANSEQRRAPTPMEDGEIAPLSAQQGMAAQQSGLAQRLGGGPSRPEVWVGNRESPYGGAAAQTCSTANLRQGKTLLRCHST
jgi:hypothetical protein